MLNITWIYLAINIDVHVLITDSDPYEYSKSVTITYVCVEIFTQHHTVNFFICSSTD